MWAEKSDTFQATIKTEILGTDAQWNILELDALKILTHRLSKAWNHLY